jgi:hypothetical protein
MRLCCAAALLVLATASCRDRSVATESPKVAGAARGGGSTLVARVTLPQASRGLSGLTRDGGGRLWSVPERSRHLLPFAHEGAAIRRAGEPIPIEGLPNGWDTESVAWIEKGTFALGTETQERGRELDHLVLVAVEGRSARVRRTIPLPYSLWGIKARVNRGIEGLCHVDGLLIAGNENVIEEGDSRYAPLARYHLGRGQWEPFRVRLLSGSGKVAAVACRAAGADALDVLAIERHYGVARLLRFQVPRIGPGGNIVPAQVADLGELLTTVPNLEGLHWSGDDVVLFVDNDTGGLTGPCEAVILRLDL